MNETSCITCGSSTNSQMMQEVYLGGVPDQTLVKKDRACGEVFFKNCSQVASSTSPFSVFFFERLIHNSRDLIWFRRGLIPGPDESEEAFSARVKKSISLGHVEWSRVAEKTLPIFGWGIDWIPIVYSNQNLAWWEGAATWSREIPSIQLRARFQNGSFLSYSKDDLLEHEAVHAARIKFQEPMFEEILAYSIGSSRWRRFLSPLFSRHWEVWVLFFAALAGGWLISIPLVVLAMQFGWLVWRQLVFRRCCRRLPLPIVLCLTDQEMRRFSRRGENFQAYLTTVPTTPRLRLLCQLMDLWLKNGSAG